jgi:hypothetical protein
VCVGVQHFGARVGGTPVAGVHFLTVTGPRSAVLAVTPNSTVPPSVPLLMAGVRSRRGLSLSTRYLSKVEWAGAGTPQDVNMSLGARRTRNLGRKATNVVCVWVWARGWGKAVGRASDHVKVHTTVHDGHTHTHTPCPARTRRPREW